MVTRAWANIHGLTHVCVLSQQDDEVVLQCVACIQKENRKFCLAAEGLGNRLCYLEPTSEAKVGKMMRLHQSCSDVEANAFSILKELNWMKRGIHCGESSMETRHPVHAHRGLVE